MFLNNIFQKIKNKKRDVIMNNWLPINMSPSKEKFEECGFVFLNKNDGVLCKVQFPDGWSIKEIEDSLWFEILDEKDRKRALVLYNPTLFRRYAFMKLEHRYYIKRVESGKYALIEHDGTELFSAISFEKVSKYFIDNFSNENDYVKAWN